MICPICNKELYENGIWLDCDLAEKGHHTWFSTEDKSWVVKDPKNYLHINSIGKNPNKLEAYYNGRVILTLDNATFDDAAKVYNFIINNKAFI